MREPAVNKGATEILAKPGDPTDKNRIKDKYLALYDPLEKDDFKRDCNRSSRTQIIVLGNASSKMVNILVVFVLLWISDSCYFIRFDT